MCGLWNAKRFMVVCIFFASFFCFLSERVKHKSHKLKCKLSKNCVRSHHHEHDDDDDDGEDDHNDDATLHSNKIYDNANDYGDDSVLVWEPDRDTEWGVL